MTVPMLLPLALGRGVVTVVPVASNVDRIDPFQVKLTAESTGLRTDSKAQAEQSSFSAVQRIGPRVGPVPAEGMACSMRLFAWTPPFDVVRRW